MHWFVLAALVVFVAVSAFLFRTMARRIRERERVTADRICELACASIRKELLAAKAEAELAREREIRQARDAHVARKRLVAMAAETHRLTREVALLREIVNGPDVELDGPTTDRERDSDTAISVAPSVQVKDKDFAKMVRVVEVARC